MVYLVSPELQRFCKQSVSNWVLELCQTYPTAEQLSRATVSKLMKINSITKEKAEKLIENARKSLATRKGGTDAFLIIQPASDLP
jgi:endonuclease III